MYIFQLDYKNVIFSIQFLQLACIFLFVEVFFLIFFINDSSYLFHTREIRLRRYEGGVLGKELSTKELLDLQMFKEQAALKITITMLILWLNPFDFMLRVLRFDSILTIFQVVIAPFGNVKFKTYLLAEILTDCTVAYMDMSRILLFLFEGEWNKHSESLTDDWYGDQPAIKFIFYCMTFLPYMWRMN